tara:strand:+ start:334 stop:579 length:246 start_codon:yes stop_codon:yes gene_type:complete
MTQKKLKKNKKQNFEEGEPTEIESIENVSWRHCNICTGEFDILGEGGIDGYIGILRFALCPCCYSGITDMVVQMNGFEDEE